MSLCANITWRGKYNPLWQNSFMDGEMHLRLEPNFIWVKWELTFLLCVSTLKFLLYLFVCLFVYLFIPPPIPGFGFKTDIAEYQGTRPFSRFPISTEAEIVFHFAWSQKCLNLTFCLIKHLYNYSLINFLRQAVFLHPQVPFIILVSEIV